MVQKLSSYTKNFFLVSGVLFLLWMLFLDSNDLYSQYKLWQKVRDLKKEQAYYMDKIEEVRADREQLLTNKELLEQFAREKYLMKKEGEDLYILVEE